MAFEDTKTEVLLALREKVVAGVWSIGMRIARDEQVRGEALAMVPIQVNLVTAMDKQLAARGVEISAPPWTE